MPVLTLAQILSASGGLWVISPEGKHLGTIITPRHVHNMTWGEDGKTLYLCARSALRVILLRFTCVMIIGAVLIMSTPPAVFSQEPPKPTRLRFPRGSHTARARGMVGGEATDYYVVFGRAGQTLTVHAISRRKRTQVGVSLVKDDSYVSGEQKDSDLTRWKGKLPATGDYLITVNVHPYAEWYTLRVTLRD